MKDEFLKYCYYGELEKLQELLRTNPIEVNVQDEDGCTGLHLAIGERYREIVKQLIHYNPDFSIKDNEGYSAIHWAILSGETYFLDLVYKHIENLQDPDNSGYFPIHLCVVHREKRSLEWVLEKGADPNVQDRDGFTALHLSAAGNLVEFGQILLALNAKTGIINKYGETPFDTAMRTKNFEFVNMLKSHNKANSADAKSRAAD